VKREIGQTPTTRPRRPGGFAGSRAAFAAVGSHYAGLFGTDPSLKPLRNAYAIPDKTIKDPERQRCMNAFFSGRVSCGTERPGRPLPIPELAGEPLIDNRPTGSIVSGQSSALWRCWPGGAMVGISPSNGTRTGGGSRRARPGPLLALKATPSMKATLKYFWVVAALIVVQVLLAGSRPLRGGGDGFTVQPEQCCRIRCAHVAHAVGHFLDRDGVAGDRFVRGAGRAATNPRATAGVNFLFTCLLVIVVGSLAGEWLGSSRSSAS